MQTPRSCRGSAGARRLGTDRSPEAVKKFTGVIAGIEFELSKASILKNRRIDFHLITAQP